jgi:hypothetical protein
VGKFVGKIARGLPSDEIVAKIWRNPIVLRTTSAFTLKLAKGDRIRVLDAHVSKLTEGEEQPVVATMTSTSEIFLSD